MAHAILKGYIGTDTLYIGGSRSHTTVYYVGGDVVSDWLSQQTNYQTEPRTLVILSGDSLAAVLRGDVLSYAAQVGYSELTPGSPESMTIGGHDLRAFLCAIAADDRGDHSVVLILMDPAEGGDLSDVFAQLAGIAGDEGA